MTIQADDLRHSIWIMFDSSSPPGLDNPAPVFLGCPFHIEAVNLPWIIGKYVVSPMTTFTYNVGYLRCSRVNKSFLNAALKAAALNITNSAFANEPVSKFPIWIRKHLESYLS